MNFQLRHNLLIATFIIVIIATMWLLMKGLSYSFGILQQKEMPVATQSEVLDKEVAYVEKIVNFSLQEFNAQQELTHFVKAKYFYNFKNLPTLLIDPTVTTFDKQGGEDFTLSSKRAHYLDSGELKFMGKVDVSSSDGMTHKINTQELLVDTNTDDLTSKKEVTYLGESAKIIAQGMRMKTKLNKMKLVGDTTIYQNSGQKVLTKDLFVDQSNNQKHYYSDHKTTYLSTQNKIYAQGIDMNMKTDITQLLGAVKILQDSGSIIDSKDLILDQTKGAEVYRTEQKIHYQSSVADIRAKSMYYDAARQKIKFSGGVVGRYD